MTLNFSLPYEKAKPLSRQLENKRLMVLVSINGSSYCPLLENGIIKLFYSADEIQTFLEKLKTKNKLKRAQQGIIGELKFDYIIFSEIDDGQY